MIRAEYNRLQKIRPIDLIVHGIYNTMTIPEALELIGSIASAINDAVKGGYLQPEKVYGPGNTPTSIPMQYNVTIPIVENTTENTATPEQDYTSDSKMSDNGQEYI